MAGKNVKKQSVFTAMAFLLLPLLAIADDYEEQMYYEEEAQYEEDYYIQAEIESANAEPKEENEFLEAGSVMQQPETADSPAGEVRSAVCVLVLQQLGIPYVPGGDNPESGFDCSGLIQYVFYNNGIAIPRNSRSQFSCGDKVGLSEIQPGDVVFFQVYSKGEYGQGAVLNKVTEYVKTKPTHVGIYLGNGVFIHAPSRGQTVKKSDLKSRFWRSHLIGIRNYTSKQAWEDSETTGVSVNADALVTDTAKAAKKAGKIFGKAVKVYKAAQEELLKP